MRQKLAIISLIFFMASGLAGIPTPQDKPLTKDQVMGLVRNQLGDESGAKMVEQRGIDFEPTDDFLRSLREAGAGDAFLKAVREARQPAKNQPAAQGPLDILQVSALLVDGVSSQRVADLISQRGITFLPSQALLQLLQDEGAEPVLLNAIRNFPTSAVTPRSLEALRKHAAVAEQDCRDRLSQEPGNVSARLLLMYALNIQGKQADALEALREGIRVRPDSATLHYRLASNLSNQLIPNIYDAQGAMAEYREALRLNPKDDRAHFGLGSILQKKGDLPAALEEYHTALTLAPNNAAYRQAYESLSASGSGSKASVAPTAQNPHCGIVGLNLAGDLENKGDLDGAIATYREVLLCSPNWGTARLSLGQLLLRKGRLDEATAEFREGVRQDSNDNRLHRALGYALIRKGDEDGALAEFREAERLEPKDDAVHYAVGQILQKKGDLPAALEEYRTALTLAPNNATYRQAYESLAASLSRSQPSAAPTAQNPQSDIATLNLGSAQAHYNHGTQLLVKGDVAGAIAEYREALRLKPDYPEAHNYLGVALSLKGELDGAVAEYREALRLKPDLAEAHRNLGLALSNKGELDMAIAEYREALRLKPDDPEAHSNLGIALSKKGDRDGAVAEFREALRLRPGFSLAHDNLGIALAEKGDLDGALLEFREAERLNPKDAGAHYLAGWILQKKGDLPAALEEYHTASTLAPTNADYRRAYDSLSASLSRSRASAAPTAQKPQSAIERLNLATSLESKGDLDGAIAAYREVLRFTPTFGTARLSLGGVLLRKGSLDEAIAEYREVVRLDPNDNRGHTALGGALIRKGDLDGALAEYRESERLEAKDDHAHYVVGMILQKKGDLTAALEEYHTALTLAPNIATYRTAYESLSASPPRLNNKLDGVNELNKGVDSFKNAQYVQAIEYFQKAIGYDPTLLDARLYLASAYFRMYVPGGDSPDNKKIGDQTIKAFEDVLQHDPQNADALKGIAAIYYYEKNFERAKQLDQELLKVQPDNPETYYWIGLLDWAIVFPKTQKVRVQLNLATPNDPTKPGILPPLPEKGRAELRDENGPLIDEGIKALEKAIQLKPDYGEAIVYLNLMYRQKADTEADQADSDADIKKANELVDQASAIFKRQRQKAATSGP